MATTDRSGRTQCQAKKTGNIKQTTAWARQEHEDEKRSSATCGGKKQGCLGSEEPIVPSYVWQNDVKASVDNTWQISPLCHMLLVRAFVLVGTNHDASVVTAEKVVITRQKGEGLDCLVLEIVKTWWHWCHASVFKTKTDIIHLRRYVVPSLTRFFMRCADSNTCD